LSLLHLPAAAEATVADPRVDRLRTDAEANLRAGIAGAAPEPLVEHALRQHPIGVPVHLLALGKAAAAMARASYRILPVHRALVIDELDPASRPQPAPHGCR
jgi:glycerate-2-kinase